MGYQDTFQRHELKYLLSPQQKSAVFAAMKGHMEGGRFQNSSISNIYFDTPDFLLIRHSLEKPIYKEKLRMRSYGIAKPDTMVFVELKKKYKSVVYKRFPFPCPKRKITCCGTARAVLDGGGIHTAHLAWGYLPLHQMFLEGQGKWKTKLGRLPKLSGKLIISGNFTRTSGLLCSFPTRGKHSPA